MENSQSQQASTNASVSTSHGRKIYTNEDVVRIRPTTRKGDVWSNYDMCIMIDGVEKAHYLDGVDMVQHETSLEGPILEDVEETIAREEVDLGISPPNTELDEGEFEDLDIEHVDVEDFLEDLMD
ncbi:hypothetical protein Tco_1456658 [Tanacetum coccineum]